MSTEYDDVACPMPECDSTLYLTWTRTRPIYAGDLTSPDLIAVEDAHTGSWRVECAEGHVVLIPGNPPDCDGEEQGHDLHDVDDELRTFRALDARRLAATLQAIRLKATASACTWYEGDPVEDVPDDYNGPCIHCSQPRDDHAQRTVITGPNPSGGDTHA